MTYEVIENGGQWIVQRGGVELARFANQADALADVSVRLRVTDAGEDPVSFRLSYQSPGK